MGDTGKTASTIAEGSLVALTKAGIKRYGITWRMCVTTIENGHARLVRADGRGAAWIVPLSMLKLVAP